MDGKLTDDEFLDSLIFFFFRNTQAISILFYDGFHIVTTKWKMRRHGLH
jgi:hypothetical protein